MSVSNQETVFQYVGNGLTVTFPYNCQVQKPNDLDVYVNDVPVISGITKNGIGNLAGGSVTFSVAPASGAAVRLERVVELERTTDYQQNGDFLARVVNPDFDRIWMALQQFSAGISRALSFPKTDVNPVTVLPDAAARANRVLGFDAQGNPIVAIPVSGSAAQVAIDLANFQDSLSKQTYDAIRAYVGTAAYLEVYTPGIAGKFVRVLSGTDDGGVTLVATNGVIWQRVYSGPVDVRWWGAKFDYTGPGTGTDDTAAIQSCINYAQPLQKQIWLPDGTAKITAQLEVAFSLFGLNMMGQGYVKTRLNYTGIVPSTDAAINIIGHSGALCGAVIEGIGFDGNASSAGIVIAGQCGQFIRNCQFGLNFFGIVFRNDAAGSFTENCIAQSCDFTRNCATDLWYNVIGSGDVSFHRSGYDQDCTTNTPDTDGYRCVIIDPTAVPYNASMNVQIWINAIGIFIDMNMYGSGRPYFKGTITTERLSGSINLCNSPAGKELPLVGKVAGYNQNFTMGSLFLVDAVIDNSSGGRQTIGGYVAKTQALTTGANAITGIPVCILAGAAQYVVNIVAPNYNYRYLLSAFAKENSGLIPIIATYSTFNSAGWGAPSFSLDPTTGYPVITNAAYPASGVTVTVEATQIGQSFYDPFFN